MKEEGITEVRKEKSVIICGYPLSICVERNDRYGMRGVFNRRRRGTRRKGEPLMGTNWH